MIRFTIDGHDETAGYYLRAHVLPGADEVTVQSELLPDAKAIALQARELADAAASLLEQIPEHVDAFEHLHDALDALPVPA